MPLPSDDNPANRYKFHMQELRDNKLSTEQSEGMTPEKVHEFKSRTDKLINLINNVEKNPRSPVPASNLDKAVSKERPNVLAMFQLQEIVHVMDEQLNSEPALKL